MKPQLTPREQQVIEQLLQGKSNKAIALALGLSVRAVEFHLSNLYAKLGVASCAEAILKITTFTASKPAQPAMASKSAPALLPRSNPTTPRTLSLSKVTAKAWTNYAARRVSWRSPSRRACARWNEPCFLRKAAKAKSASSAGTPATATGAAPIGFSCPRPYK